MIRKLKKSFNRIFSVALLIVLATSMFVLAVPKKTNDFYLADYANVIGSETENLILNINKKYESTKEKPQIVVLTVDNLDGLDPQSYATQTFEEWEIGNKSLDNGVLLLLAIEERQIQVEVGYGLEGALNDSKIGRILDNNIVSLSNNDFNSGIKGVFYDISNEVNIEYNYDMVLDEYESMINELPRGGDSTREENSISRTILMILLLLFILFGPRMGPMGGIGGFGRGGFGGGGFGGGGFGDSGGSSGGGGRSGGGGAGRGF